MHKGYEFSQPPKNPYTARSINRLKGRLPKPTQPVDLEAMEAAIRRRATGR